MYHVPPFVHMPHKSLDQGSFGKCTDIPENLSHCIHHIQYHGELHYTGSLPQDTNHTLDHFLPTSKRGAMGRA